MFDISEKLKNLRNESGLTQEEVAKKLGITKPTYAGYEKGKDISLNTLNKISKLFKIPVETFILNESSNFYSNEKVKRIPIVSKVSAGKGKYGVDNILDWLELPSALVKNADFATFVEGDSMEPKIHDDDLLLVQDTPVLDSGEIGIFRYDENVYCKKFQYNPLKEEIVLKSLNIDYSPIKIENMEDFRIIGRVVGKIEYNI